jgi:ribosomal 50S subunit-associated protein YjgA (DUF615 family)
MSEIDTTPEAVERRCLALEELRATLRALAAERDALTVSRDLAVDEAVQAEAERDAARKGALALASQVTEAQAQVARLREALDQMYNMVNKSVSRFDLVDAIRAALAEAGHE